LEVQGGFKKGRSNIGCIATMNRLIKNGENTTYQHTLGLSIMKKLLTDYTKITFVI